MQLFYDMFQEKILYSENYERCKNVHTNVLIDSFIMKICVVQLKLSQNEPRGHIYVN